MPAFAARAQSVRTATLAAVARFPAWSRTCTSTRMDHTCRPACTTSDSRSTAPAGAAQRTQRQRASALHALCVQARENKFLLRLPLCLRPRSRTRLNSTVASLCLPGSKSGDAMGLNSAVSANRPSLGRSANGADCEHGCSLSRRARETCAPPHAPARPSPPPTRACRPAAPRRCRRGAPARARGVSA